MMDLKLGPKQKRALITIGAGVLGANVVLTTFNIKFLNDLLNIALIGPITIGLLVGAAGVYSAYLLMTGGY